MSCPFFFNLRIVNPQPCGIRAFPGDERIALVGAGGLSHWVGVPRVGDIDEEFDRWFLDRLAKGEVESILDMADDEIALAGNGAHEIRSWVAVAATGSHRSGDRHGVRTHHRVDHRHGSRAVSRLIACDDLGPYMAFHAGGGGPFPSTLS